MKSILRQAFIGVALAAVFVVTAPAVMAAGAHEDDIYPCYDITGRTTAVLIDGVPNAGVLDFDALAADVDPEYAACVRMSSDDPATAVPVNIQGWVKSDNLGWISFYCAQDDMDGLAEASDTTGPRRNLGIECGDYDYSVDFNVTTGTETPPDYDSVTLSGEAFGDNVGYITFATLPYHQIGPVPNGASRGLITDASDVTSAFTWADSVGWFNWTGVRLPWENIIPPDPIIVCAQDDYVAGTGVCGCDLVRGCVTTDVNTPIADDVDSWKMKVSFEDLGGAVDPANINFLTPCQDVDLKTQSPDPLKPYGACIDIRWDDSVDRDQTTLASQNNKASNPYGLISRKIIQTGLKNNNQASVTKPLNYLDFVNTYTAGSYDILEVTSIAPTSGGNISIDDLEDDNKLVFQNERFYYYPNNVFDLGDYDVEAGVDNNKLVLEALEVMFFSYSLDGTTPGACIYGNLNGDICSAYNYVDEKQLNFKPYIQMQTLNQEAGDEDLNYLSIIFGDSVDINYDLIRNDDYVNGIVPSVKAFIGLGVTPVAETEYKLNFIVPATEPDTPDQELASQDVALTSASSWLARLSLINTDSAPASSPQDDNQYLYTEISHDMDGVPITYWGNKLPRVAASLIKNPVAFIKGTVLARTSLGQKASDIDYSNVGTFGNDTTRDKIYLNVQAIINNANLSGSYIDSDVDLTDSLNGFNGLDELEGGVYYIKDADITIDCSGDCDLKNTITIIVVDGSIKIESNIKPDPGVQLGLIALDEDRSLDDAHLYVESAVTDILNTQILIDGLIMSYVDEIGYGINEAGWPIFKNDFDRQDKLVNQLRFVGTFDQSNGIGNATGETILDHLGNELNFSSGEYAKADYGAPTGLALARTVDLNFLRYYGPTLELCSNGQIKDQDADPEWECNPDDYRYDINAEQLAPAGDLISGDKSGEKAALYASGNDILTEYPIYFEFQAISPQLKGFNSAVEIR